MIRSRWKWVLLGVVLLLVAAELGLNALKPPVVLVKVMNRGDEPLLNLIITSGSARAALDRIDPQQSGMLSISSRDKKPLVLKFNQLNNPMADFEVPDFDPQSLSRDGSILVLELGTQEVARYHEPDETPSRWARLVASIRRAFEEEKGTEP